MPRCCCSPAGCRRTSAGATTTWPRSLIFTVSSAACGFARSLPELIFFRILQGLGGGGLQPVTQAVLVDTFPAEKQGAAQALFGISALVAPVLGPTLGGYIADNYSWEWIFFINIPPGLLALAVNYAVLRDPDYLKAERAAMRSKPLRFDSIGLGLIVLSMACMEILLSKGQEWDWLGDPFGRVQVLMVGLGLGLASLIFWELRHPSPILNLRPFARPQFRGQRADRLCRVRDHLRQHGPAAGHAPDALRLQRRVVGPGDVAGRALLDPDHGAGGLPDRQEG